jgi:formylmethanofuran dehydrogenase subunit D
MMGLSGSLITVRTGRQGAMREKSKFCREYIDEISCLTLNTEDMESLGLREDKKARLKTERGEIIVTCRPGNVRTGLFFMPLGHICNLVTPGDSMGTGVPDFKGVDAFLTPVGSEEVIKDNE